MNFREITPQEIQSSLINIRQITFEVTDACNLQCKYCGYGDLYFGYDKRESNYMTFTQAKSIIDYLANLWNSNKAASYKARTYFSFYGGEPLLNMPLIMLIVEYIESIKLNRNIIYSMTTNAMLLDRYMEYLVNKKFHLLISLDGNKESQSYRVTKNGANSFDTVYKNVKNLQKQYPRYFAECVNFNSVLHNRSTVEGIYSFVKTEFGKEPTISELNNSGIRGDKKAEFDLVYRNKEESLHNSDNYEKLSQELFMSEPNTSNLLTYIHQYSGNVYKDYNSLFIDKSKLQYTPTGTCTPFSKKMFITVNGKILQCERIDHNFALGQITDNGVILDLDVITKKFNGYINRLKKQCELCFRNESCIQCLYYIPDVDSEDAICHGFMDEDIFKNYSMYCLGHLARHPYLYEKLMNDVMVD